MAESRNCTTCAELMLENSKLKHENEALHAKKSLVPLVRNIGSGIGRAWKFFCDELIGFIIVAAIIGCIAYGGFVGIRALVRMDAAANEQEEREVAAAVAQPQLTFMEMIELDGKKIDKMNDKWHVLKIDNKWYNLTPLDFANCYESGEYGTHFRVRRLCEFYDQLSTDMRRYSEVSKKRDEFLKSVGQEKK